MSQMKASAVRHNREELYAALWYAASLHCLVEAWHDCGELKLKPWFLWIEKEKPRSIVRNGVQPQADTVA